MSARRPAEAVQNYVDSLQLALSCVTDAVLSIAGGYYQAGAPHVLMLNSGKPAALRGTPSLDLILTQNDVVERTSGNGNNWAVRTTAYWYTLQRHERADSPIQELVSYQWHPHLRSSVAYPHLHLGNGAGSLIRQLTRAHLPTGRIALETMLQCAVRDLGVLPQRSDWEAILRQTKPRR
jgi:hypothetical protein